MGNVFTHKAVFFTSLTKIEKKCPISQDDHKVIGNCRWTFWGRNFLMSHLPALEHFLALFYDILPTLFTSIPFQDQKLAMNGFDQVSRHISELDWLSLLNLLNQWYMRSFIGDFLFSWEAAKCNREVGSQIENLRVVIAIAEERFILLDSFHRSAHISIYRRR